MYIGLLKGVGIRAYGVGLRFERPEFRVKSSYSWKRNYNTRKPDSQTTKVLLQAPTKATSPLNHQNCIVNASRPRYSEARQPNYSSMTDEGVSPKPCALNRKALQGIHAVTKHIEGAFVIANLI